MIEGRPTIEELRDRLHGKIAAKRHTRIKQTNLNVNDASAFIHQNLTGGKYSPASSTMVSSLLNLMGKLRDGVTSQKEAAGIVTELQDSLHHMPRSQRKGIGDILERVSGNNEGLRQLVRQLVTSRSEEDNKDSKHIDSSNNSEAGIHINNNKKNKRKKKKKKKKPKIIETKNNETKSNKSVLMSIDGLRPAFVVK